VIEVPVLIVGGGPVGLAASILLSRQGIASRLVERHSGTAFHPKARSVNMRTMEVLRQCGMEDAVRAAGLSPERTGYIIWTESLAGREIERRVPRRSVAEGAPITATPHCLCAQDDLEPVLRRHAEALAPGAVTFETELTDFSQDADGVTATIRNGSRESSEVRARYLIAADGPRSRLRQGLDIPMRGTPAIYRSVNVLLNVDLTPWTSHRPAALYFVQQAGLQAVFLTINGINRWGFLINLPLEGPDEPYTPERCEAIVRRAVGVPDLDVKVLGIDPWIAAALVAERFQSGRVFLAGDAAHTMPPTGGFGLNSGVQDVHNLTWKITAVLNGWASPRLLDTYDEERRPYGTFLTEESHRSAISMRRGVSTAHDGPSAAADARPEFQNEIGMVFGARYASAAVIPDGTPPVTVDNPVTQYRPSARPGERAPHVWLERDGRQVSVLDLVGFKFALLAGERGAPWRDAACTLSDAHGIPLAAYTVGRHADIRDPSGRWATIYEVEADGAVLVRPDGHVAWRSRGGAMDSRQALECVLGRVLHGRL
jgi:2-polyprenyl-6-methoxyphenol hydroxylase-like FAD-dependent oxidoreductase